MTEFGPVQQTSPQVNPLTGGESGADIKLPGSGAEAPKQLGGGFGAGGAGWRLGGGGQRGGGNGQRGGQGGQAVAAVATRFRAASGSCMTASTSFPTTQLTIAWSFEETKTTSTSFRLTSTFSTWRLARLR